METTLAEKVLEARERIKGYVRKTPLEFSPFLTGLLQNGPKVYLKMESEQLTGSFKLRGAFNKISLLVEESPSIRELGAVTASSGNHGLACTMAKEKLGVSVKVFIPETSPKKDILRAYKADFVVFGEDCVDAENKARQTAKEEGIPYISPYNDIDVAAGQGTISVEIIEDLPEVDAVFISVGGGGLIAGMAAYLKQVNSNIKIIGCQPKLSSVMYDSIKAGRIVFTESGDTLSDGTSGGIEEGAVTFEFCQKYVDEWILVSEEEIAQAVYFVLDKHHKVMEGAAGVAVAAYMNNLQRFQSFKNVAILICGANIATNKLTDIINSRR